MLEYIIMGYLLFSLTSSDETKGKNKFDIFIQDFFKEDTFNTSIQCEIDIQDTLVKIHIHHWLIMYFVFVLAKYNSLERIKFFALGGIIQGIVNYSDWFKIITFS